MNAPLPDAQPAQRHTLGIALVGGGLACFVAAGLLLWWRHGDAVFASYLQAALAWCF